MMVAERVVEAEMGEMRAIQRVELDEATARGRSGGSARTKATAPATASIPSASDALTARLARAAWKSGGSGAPIRLDRRDEVAPG